MLTPESSLLTVLLSLAAAFLSLSIAVQICQELWKYLTSSKSRAFKKALVDLLGPWANDVLREIAQTALRGPFQMLRFKPGETILPLSREALATAVDKTAPPWVRRTHEVIETELALQTGSPRPPSMLWNAFVRELSATKQGADDIKEFLQDWTPARRGKSGGDQATLDARQLYIAFRRRFCRDADAILEKYPVFEQNFTYSYRRRNMRQTFTIALLIAFFFHLPFEVLYQKATTVSPDQATTVAEKAIDLYDRSPKDSLGRADRTITTLVTDATRVMSLAFEKQSIDYLVDLQTLRTMWGAGFPTMARYVLGLLITALLVSFGAPVWNDITSILLRTAKGRTKVGDSE